MSTTRLKDFVINKSIRAESIPGYEEMEVLGVSNKLGITVTDHKKSKDLAKYLLIEEGDFAYNPYRINVGSIGLTPAGKRGLVSPAYVVFSATDKLIPVLLLDFLKSQEGLRQIGKYARGTVRKALRFEDLAQIELPVPPMNKQIEILSKRKSIEIEVDSVKSELTHQQTLLKELRQQILQEAIEGKLTADWRAQTPNVEPASELLKRIAAEKAQLVKGKKSKAQKPLPPITDEEKPFELPQGWEWCRFQDVAEICSNLVNPYDYYELPHIAPNHIEKNTGRLLTYQSAREDEVISGKHLFYPGQLLYSKVRPQLNKVAFAPCEGLCSADMYPIEAYIVPSYLQKVMLSQHFLNEVNRFDNRVKMPKINQNQLSSIIIPCPPLNEQQAIATKIENLVALCDQLETQITQNQAHAEQLMQAVLKEAFSHNSETKPTTKQNKLGTNSLEAIRA